MPPKSSLLFPPSGLASCIATAVVRDTRGSSLGDMDRLNYFPASPLFAVTCVLSGALHMVTEIRDLETLRNSRPMPAISVTPPQDTPISSWSPGPVAAITIGFFPDAWIRLGGEPDSNLLPETLGEALATFQSADGLDQQWAVFCTALAPLWSSRREASKLSDWSGSNRVADWSRHVLSRIVVTGPGRSMRTMERRLRRWTGQTRQSLEFYARIEELHRMRVETPDAPLAAIAVDADYSDQSHMGRDIKRATGFSPARLNRMIETEEAFWCYRLMGQRF